MWIDIIQNTQEWENIRVGKITSSNFAKVMANYGKAFGNPAKEYAEKLANEIITGEKYSLGSFRSSAMERGNELEPIAIAKYEEEEFVSVTNGGFNILDETLNNVIQIGDSPDGNIGDKGCCEVKSVYLNTQNKTLKRADIDPSYKYQVQGHIWSGKKEWCDYISFCPEIYKGSKLFVKRVYRDDEIIKQMEQRIMKDFVEEIQKEIYLLEKRAA